MTTTAVKVDNKVAGENTTFASTPCRRCGCPRAEHVFGYSFGKQRYGRCKVCRQSRCPQFEESTAPAAVTPTPAAAAAPTPARVEAAVGEAAVSPRRRVTPAPAAVVDREVLASWPAWQCLTCGSRYRAELDEHGAPQRCPGELVAVDVLIARRADR